MEHPSDWIFTLLVLVLWLAGIRAATRREGPPSLAKALGFIWILGIIAYVWWRQVAPPAGFLTLIPDDFAFLAICVFASVYVLTLSALLSAGRHFSRPGSCRLEGEVRDHVGQIVVEGRVELYAEPNVHVLPVAWGPVEGGEFRLEGINPGVYRVKVVADDQGAWLETVRFTGADPELSVHARLSPDVSPEEPDVEF